MQYRVKNGCSIDGVFHGPGKIIALDAVRHGWVIDGEYVEPVEAKVEDVPDTNPMQAAPLNGMAQPPQHKGKDGRKGKPGMMGRLFEPSQRRQ